MVHSNKFRRGAIFYILSICFIASIGLSQSRIIPIELEVNETAINGFITAQTFPTLKRHI